MRPVWRAIVLCAVLPAGAAAAGEAPRLSISDVLIPEGSGPATQAVFQVELLGSATETVTVDWATADLTATAGEDYVAASGQVKFLPTDPRMAEITVPVLGDEKSEPAEGFFVHLSNVVNAGIVKGTGHAAIVDDDAYVAAAAKGDLDGTGRSDLIVSYSDSAVRRHAEWHKPWGITVTVAQSLGEPVWAPGWDIVATNDFNGDGICDLVWWDRRENLAVTITPEDRSLRGPTPDDIVSSDMEENWTVVGSGRFGPDPYADLLLWNERTGALEVWDSDGVRFPSFPNHRSFSGDPDTAWRAAAISDTNRDGNPDLLWQHAETGQIRYWRRAWQLHDEHIDVGVPNPEGPQDPHWHLVASGDLDGDGAEDLVFQRGDGYLTLVVWFMRGTERITGSFLSPSHLGPPESEPLHNPEHLEAWAIRGPR